MSLWEAAAAAALGILMLLHSIVRGALPLFRNSWCETQGTVEYASNNNKLQNYDLVYDVCITFYSKTVTFLSYYKYYKILLIINKWINRYIYQTLYNCIVYNSLNNIATLNKHRPLQRIKIRIALLYNNTLKLKLLYTRFAS